MTQLDGTAKVLLLGALIGTVWNALPVLPAFGEGGARRDVVRQAAEASGAERAAPLSLSKDATIMSRDGRVVRKGSNRWICLPDNPDTKGTDSICMDEPWNNFLEALKNKSKPTITQIGIAYMLQGDRPVSNTDPYATEPRPGDDWVEGLGAHVMIILPDTKALSKLSTDSKNGGPWVMWHGTPFAHIMVPIDSYPLR
jgi:hypothetical protein